MNAFVKCSCCTAPATHEVEFKNGTVWTRCASHVPTTAIRVTQTSN